MRTLYTSTAVAGSLVAAETIRAPCGSAIVRRGRLLTSQDTAALAAAGIAEIPTVLFEAHQIPEHQAALDVAAALAARRPYVITRAGKAGRAEIIVTHDSVITINAPGVAALNSSDQIAIATIPDLTHAPAGSRIAVVKAHPFAADADTVASLLESVRRQAPIIQAAPIQDPTIGVIYSDPTSGDRAERMFDRILRARFARIPGIKFACLNLREDAALIAQALHVLERHAPTLILIASTTVPAGPADVVARGIIGHGASLESFLAPVEPGSLLLLARRPQGPPIVAAPGCFREPGPNVLDIVVPAVLAGVRLDRARLASLGHGGLLKP